MGDMGDDWRAWKADAKEAAAKRRERAPQMLRDKGISFSSHNDGAHLIVRAGFDVWDFWPGTGKWARRSQLPGKAPKRGRGLLNLISDVKRWKP